MSKKTKFSSKNVLVAGGTGMIGIPLVRMLLDQGAKVRVSSLDDPSRAHREAEFLRADLTVLENCRKACRGMDYVFNLLGLKGSPAVAVGRPATFHRTITLLNTNMLEGARLEGVGGFLYTSSIGVYEPAEVLTEDVVWKTFPSRNDWAAGWAKRMGELAIESYREEYGWKELDIVRPANVYGPYDNFAGESAMVVPALIRRAVGGENPLNVWGDGSAVRDFVYADDVAGGMLQVAETNPRKPVNLGTGGGVSIKELVEEVVKNVEPCPEIRWDPSKPRGDARRVLDHKRAASLGITPKISLSEGVKRTVEWYREHPIDVDRRYDAFAAKSSS